jgi:hypothetical protein
MLSTAAVVGNPTTKALLKPNTAVVVGLYRSMEAIDKEWRVRLLDVVLCAFVIPPGVAS